MMKYMAFISIIYVFHVYNSDTFTSQYIPSRGGTFDMVLVQPSREVMSVVNVFNNSFYNDMLAAIIPYVYIAGTKPIWPLIGGSGMIMTIALYQSVGLSLHIGILSKQTFTHFIQNPKDSVLEIVSHVKEWFEEFEQLKKNAAVVKKWISGEFKRRISNIKRTISMVLRTVVQMLKGLFNGMSLTNIICSGINTPFMKNKYMSTLLRSYFGCVDNKELPKSSVNTNLVDL